MKNFLKSNKYVGSTAVDENLLTIEIDGKSAHGSTPEEGVNAAFLLIDFFNEVGLTNTFVHAINTYLLNDTEGKKIGIDHYDEEMGGVTVNAGVFNLENNEFEIVLNPRYPNGVNPEIFVKN